MTTPVKLRAALRGFVFFRGPLTAIAVEGAFLGEFYVLEREPSNPYHSNAVKVIHLKTDRAFCYIERAAADYIAPFMDDGWIFTAHCVETPILRFRPRGNSQILNDSFVVEITPIKPIQLKKQVTRKVEENV